MTKKVFAVLLVLCLMALVACGQGRTLPSTHIRHVRVAQWGQERYLIYLPLYLAQSQGFFRAHNLEVELLFSGNDDQVFATVVRGDAQFGVGDPIFTAVSTERGLSGVVVASIVSRVALWGVAKAGTRSIKDAKDFSGLKVGSFPRPSTTYTLLADTLKQGNVQGAKIVEVQIGSELALLESGGADVVLLLEPAASLAESTGYSVVTDLPSLWGDFAFTGLTTTKAYVTSNPSIASDMRSAIDDALRSAHSNPAAVVEAARALFPKLEPKIVNRAVQRMLEDNTIPTSATVSQKGWSQAVRIRQEMGDLKNGSNHFECLWTPR